MEPMENSKKSFGPLIATIIIVIILIAGAFYFWGNNNERREAVVAPVSNSDEISSIEADLSVPTTEPDLSGLGAE